MQAWSRRYRQRGWVLRATLLVMLAVLIIPAVLLILASLLVGAVTFLVLSLVAKVMELTGAAPRESADDGAAGPELGRQNVRVIRDEV